MYLGRSHHLSFQFTGRGTPAGDEHSNRASGSEQAGECMKLGNLVTGRLVRRYKRFLADIELDEPLQGESLITVHCPNTGAMTGCAEPGSRVWLQESTNSRRKYRYTWELVQVST